MANGHGTFTYGGSNQGDEPRLYDDAYMIGVFKYNKDEADHDKAFTVLPNILCEAVTFSEDLKPPTAKFRYVLDDTATANKWPTQYEQIFALQQKGSKTRDAAKRAAYVVQPDDRLVVCAWKNPTSKVDYQILFDGFAEEPEVNAAPNGQVVHFQAAGAGVRLWETALHQRLERDATTPNTPGQDSRHWVDLPVQFNPKGQANATPDGHNEGDSPYTYPIFLDSSLKDRTPDPRTKWTLPKFCRYLMGLYNSDEEYVDNCDFAVMDKLLKARVPKEGATTFNPDDSSTFDAKDIELNDFDATGMYWPDAMRDRLEYYGFGAKFVLERDKDGRPVNRIEIYRKDGTGIGSPRDVWHQDARADLDPSQCNTSEFSVTRDYKRTYNAVIVDTEPELWEVSIVLAPGFSPAIGDESAANRTQFLKSRLSTMSSGTTRAKYRLYVADEAGDGHWDKDSNTWVTDQPFDFTSIFPNVDGVRSYCQRRRVPRGTLLKRDTAGNPYPAQLALSRDYTGAMAVLWDGTGHWQPITGGYRLLKDRVGILVTCEDPDQWPIGDYKDANPQEKSSTLRGIISQANPTAPNTRFYLRLTTVIEGDVRPVHRIEPRKTSAMAKTRTIYSRGREHFKFEYIAPKSLYNTSDQKETVTNDEAKVRAHADQLQQSHENPSLAGRITIPQIDTAYQIGEIVKRIRGRELTLQINVGVEQREAARYPTIVGVTFELSGRQATILQLGDHRAGNR